MHDVGHAIHLCRETLSLPHYLQYYFVVIVLLFKYNISHPLYSGFKE